MHWLNNQRVDIHRLLKAFACKKCKKYKDNFFFTKKEITFKRKSKEF